MVRFYRQPNFGVAFIFYLSFILISCSNPSGENSQFDNNFGDTSDVVEDEPEDSTSESDSEVDRIEKVSVGGSHSCALSSEGMVLCWGDANQGRLGDGDSEASESDTPVAVVDEGEGQGGRPLRGVSRMSSGESHTCVLKSGEVYCWGEGSDGQLGHGKLESSFSPVKVKKSDAAEDFLDGVEDVSVGGTHTCALRSGDVFCWGRGDKGQLGNGNFENVSIPVQVVESDESTNVLSGIEQISLGRSHTCVLREGEVLCWGSGGRGQLGDNKQMDSSTPTTVVMNGESIEPLNDIVQIRLGSEYTCAIKAMGAAIFCWGSGDRGQLGNNMKEDIPFPMPVRGVEGIGYLSSIKEISAGETHTCALTLRATTRFAGGQVLCWGAGDKGRLGSGLLADGSINEEDSTTPVRVVIDKDQNPLSGVRSISVGSQHTCAVRGYQEMREVLCWGAGGKGRLGKRKSKDESSALPVEVPPPPILREDTSEDDSGPRRKRQLSEDEDDSGSTSGEGEYDEYGEEGGPPGGPPREPHSPPGTRPDEDDGGATSGEYDEYGEEGGPPGGPPREPRSPPGTRSDEDDGGSTSGEGEYDEYGEEGGPPGGPPREPRSPPGTRSDEDDGGATSGEGESGEYGEEGGSPGGPPREPRSPPGTRSDEDDGGATSGEGESGEYGEEGGSPGGPPREPRSPPGTRSDEDDGGATSGEGESGENEDDFTTRSRRPQSYFKKLWIGYINNGVSWAGRV